MSKFKRGQIVKCEKIEYFVLSVKGINEGITFYRVIDAWKENPSQTYIAEDKLTLPMYRCGEGLYVCKKDVYLIDKNAHTECCECEDEEGLERFRQRQIKIKKGKE